MKKQNRRTRRQRFGNFAQLLRSRRRRETRRLGARFEHLEPRMLLHGGTDAPHDHDPPGSPSDHIHAQLNIVLDGQKVQIPGDIGVSSGGIHAFVHTHDDDGVIHAHALGSQSPSDFLTLGDFFDTWRTDAGIPGNNPDAVFNAGQLMDQVASGDKLVRMFVNSQPSTQYANYKFHDGDQIVLSFESASSATSPTILPIDDQQLLSGSPLHVVLDGHDPDGQPLSYTVTSSNSDIQASVLQGNRSMRITVEGYGDIVFELFEDEVPRVIERMEQLVNSGFYNKSTGSQVVFHRVINDFVIQAGDPTGTGSGGSTLGDFDDQFHQDLQHNRKGLLSFAKSSDDTNDSQFFITEKATRSLDFNHSIFGILTQGESVRERISNVATDSSDKPVTPIVISKVEFLNDTENRVLRLKAAEGVTAQSDITVTAADTSGNSFSRTFKVSATPDTSNSAPFLKDIPAVQTTVNTPVSFQLEAIDVEGHAVHFEATQDSRVTINNDTGLVTVTPAADFVGTIDFLVGVRAKANDANTVDTFDTQRVSVAVAPAAPTAVDLLDDSDSGVLNNDNVTNKTALQFRVDGVRSGATVRLRSGSVVLGEAVASGTSAVVTVDNFGALGDGAHTLTATQTASGVESAVGGGLTVTLDTVAPADLTSSPPASVNLGDTFTYDAQHAEEGQTGFNYSLTNAPAGATIDAATGIVQWTPTANQVGAVQFVVLATDAAGNARQQLVDVQVSGQVLMQFQLSTTDLSGTPISSVALGDEFLLHVFVQDTRDNPQGVFAAYLDVLAQNGLVSPAGSLEYASQYTTARSGSVSGSEIDEAGGASTNISPLGGDEFLLFTIRMQADSLGQETFTSNAADVHPDHDVLLFGTNDAVPLNQIGFGTTSIEVRVAFDAVDDLFNFDEDSSGNVLNVLSNDKQPDGSNSTLSITDVGSTNQGGTVSIAGDKRSLIYTPAANFFGEETFTYTVTDGNGATEAAVTVEVHPINDNPTAVDDSFDADQNSSQKLLDLLGNDKIEPDANETLRIVSVGTTSAGGTVTIGSAGSHVLYTPVSSFAGKETFTYTVSDGNGGTSQATATVTVKGLSGGPAAAEDEFDVDEDSSGHVFDLLQNDTTDVAGATLTIKSVGSTSHGGTVAMAADGKTVTYTPKANFFGTETFTYTIGDGQKEAQGTVQVRVAAKNDAPTANTDQLTIVKDTVDQELDVLANDSILPDAGETLKITAVTQPSQGGDLSITANGSRLKYTPVTGFLGDETFTYTISDGNGGTAQATVTVSVVDYIPSSLAGIVFVDADNSGLRENGEVTMGGVTVTLSGTDIFGNSVSQVKTTAADGSYSFVNLAPGNYQLTQTQPVFMIDGHTVVGSQGGSTSAANQIAIQLAQDTDGTNNNFAERGRVAASISIRDFLSSTPRDHLLAAVNQDGQQQWYTFDSHASGDWSNVKSAVVQANSDATQVDLTVRDSHDHEHKATVSGRPRVHVVVQENSSRLLRVAGRESDFQFQTTETASAAAASSSQSDHSGHDHSGHDHSGHDHGTGEGEQPSATSSIAARPIYHHGQLPAAISDSSTSVSENKPAVDSDRTPARPGSPLMPLQTAPPNADATHNGAVRTTAAGASADSTGTAEDAALEEILWGAVEEDSPRESMLERWIRMSRGENEEFEAAVDELLGQDLWHVL